MAIDKEKYREHILNYHSQIKTFETFTEAVRQSVAQFLGNTGTLGHMNMIREIIQNALDQIIKKDSPADRAVIRFDERDHSTTVTDNGLGIPFDHIINTFVTEHTSSNYDKKKGSGQYTSGRHGVGAKATNAASTIFTIESYNCILNEARRVEFHEGIPWDKGEVEIPMPSEDAQGTTVYFRPSYDVMGIIETTWKDVYDLVESIILVMPLGTKVHFIGIDKNGVEYVDTLENKEGVVAGLYAMTQNPIIKPITLFVDNGTMFIDIAFTYDSDSLGGETISSFSNFCPTPRCGTHVDGFLDGLTKFFRDYMNKIYLNTSKTNAKKKQISASLNDIKTGLKAVIHGSHILPNFSGQAKESLSNPEMRPFVSENITAYLNNWVKENPSDLQKLCRFFKEVIEARAKGDQSRLVISKKYKQTVLSGLPKKYIPPTGHEDLELCILEGDSALGSARDARCPRRQGLFPIRGKLPNAFTCKESEFLSNEEVSAIITLIFLNSGIDINTKNPNPDNIIWKKIIFFPDADADGSHIKNLLLMMIAAYMPWLILSGKIYGNYPPLYGIRINKDYKYFVDNLDFIKYVYGIFAKNNKIADAYGAMLDRNSIIDLLYRNMEYTYHVEKIKTTFAVNPYLLEHCLLFRNLPFDKFAHEIESRYRFIRASKNKGTIVVEGALGKCQTLIMNDKFMHECRDVIALLDSSPASFRLNDKPTGLYGLMSAYDSSKPTNITRYKGIGEMNASQLKESSLHPDSNRTLMQYTTENITEDIKLMREIESNKSSLLTDLIVRKIDLV